MPKQKKIKVAVFHNLPRGGAKRYLYEIVSRLGKTYEIDEFKISTSSPYLDLSRVVNITRTYAYQGESGIKSVIRSIIELPKIHAKIAKDINSGAYDLVVTNHDYFTKSPYIHRYLTTPSLYICHEPQREFYEDYGVHAPRVREKIMNILRYPIKNIDRTNTKAADWIISNSKYSKKYLESVYGMKPDLIYPGVDKNKFVYSGKKKNFVLAVGSLMPIKGHDFVIRALGKIEKKYRPALIIVGSSNTYYKNRLVRMAKTVGVKLNILNKVTDTQIKKLFSSSLAYVSGAYKEPFGLCILEAMASGTPAVITKGGGAGEQITIGVDGFITGRDEAKFADKLLTIISSKDKNVFGIKARKSVDTWTWEQAAKKLDGVIIKTLQKYK